MEVKKVLNKRYKVRNTKRKIFNYFVDAQKKQSDSQRKVDATDCFNYFFV